MPGIGANVVAIMKKINKRKTQSISGVMLTSISDFLLLLPAASSFKLVTP
jgi:hypothetical protein